MGWILPALFAGVVAIGVTVAIERWGGRIGGLIGSMPSTIVPATIGMAQMSHSEEMLSSALYMTPVGMWINGIFLLTWMLPTRWPSRWTKNLGTITALSLLAWGALSVTFIQGVHSLVEAGHELMYLSLLATAGLLVTGIKVCSNAPPAPAGHRKVSPLTLVTRGVLAALAIAAAVLLAKAGSPLAAGVAAVFPAIFLTTMVSLWVSQGHAVQVGAVGPMILGCTSVSVFALLAAWTIPLWGIWVGCTVSWFGSVATVTLPAWRWLHPKNRPPSG